MEELNMQKAQEVYEALCNMLDSMDWQYERFQDDLTIKSGVSGEDLPINFLMYINPKNELITFYSPMPYKIEENKRVDMAIAICVANFNLVNGSFDYDISDGSVAFKLNSSYKNSIISEDLLQYMLGASVTTIDAFNDKFFMISKGMLSLEDFIKGETNKDN